MKLLSKYVEFKNGKKRPTSKGTIPVYGGNGILDYTNTANMQSGVVIGRVGVYCGSVFLVREECWVSDNAIKAMCKENMDLGYLYYLLSSLHLNERRIGTSQPLLTQSILNNIEVEIPELAIQKRISSILELFDEKIKLNNKINNNLEQQAQALFKEWFIDNPENIYWSTGTFRELIQSTLNGDWGKETPTGNNIEKVYCIRGADIPEVKAGNKGKMPTRYILPKNLANKKLEAGDIVVEISGGSPTQSTGRCTAITQSLLDRYDSSMVCTNFCKAIKPKNGYTKMNWNSGDGLYKILPVTLDFAKALSRVAKQDLVVYDRPYNFRYFM